CGWAVGQQKLARAIRVTQLPLLLKYCCASTAVRPAGQLELAAEGSTSREEKSPNRVLVEVDEPVRRSDTADGGTRLIIMADRWPRCIAAAHRPGRLLAPHTARGGTRRGSSARLLGADRSRCEHGRASQGWIARPAHGAAHACTITCMVALQIRDVPEELRDRLS